MMLTPTERDAIVTAVTQLVAAHHTGKTVTQPRTAWALAALAARDMLLEHRTRALLDLLDSLTDETA